MPTISEECIPSIGCSDGYACKQKEETDPYFCQVGKQITTVVILSAIANLSNPSACFFFSKWLCFVKVPSLYGESCMQDVGCQSETNTLLLCEWTGPKFNTCVSQKYAGEACRTASDCVNNQVCFNVVGGARRCNDVMNIVIEPQILHELSYC